MEQEVHNEVHGRLARVADDYVKKYNLLLLMEVENAAKTPNTVMHRSRR